MPTRPDVLGFGNEWYEPALADAAAVELPSGRRIRMVRGPYFLATKLAAFDDRGDGDYVMSHDLEDIVAVLDGRAEIVNEVRRSDAALRRHLATRFDALLRDPRFLEALPGHMPGDTASQARLPLIVARIQELAGNARA
jgi:predicted nucleotidyltransferase